MPSGNPGQPRPNRRGMHHVMRNNSARPGADTAFCLTPRERQILELADRGHTGPEIGAELGIQSDSARHYLSIARDKVAAGAPR